MNLYNITKEYLEILDQIEENEGIVSEDLLLSLQQNENHSDENLIEQAKLVLTINNDINLIDKEVERLKELKTKKQAAVVTLKLRIMQNMKFFNKEKINNGVYSLSIRKSKATEIFDDSIIPNQFKKTKTEITISKTDIKNSIDSGISVPGARIITNESLIIK